MRFQRGQSGNPGGRPAMPQELRDSLQELSEKAVKRLGELLDHNNGNIRLRAAERILDRAWGRPAMAVELEGVPASSLAGISDGALDKLIQEIERLAARSESGPPR